LRADALVEESAGPQRGRARSLQLTAAGKRRLGGAHAAVLRVEQDMLTGIPGKAQRELASLLLRCAENLEGAATETPIHG
ncbi:MarR family transcriptional regulator, partial [Mycobacterium sp. 20091114027_K0903767]|nr:MarR family transcriptional regulator [Mycobacterium sp. 20091114027_K0903767]